jgi:hypothetical protein
MGERVTQLQGAGRIPERVREMMHDRVTLLLCAVFVLGAAFYLWTAGSTYKLALTGAQSEPYNELASAFLHFHLSIGKAPAGLVNLPNPYSPQQNAAYQEAYHDLALYRGNLFLTWGPAPVIVLLVPLRLLGFAPSASLVTALLVAAGLGFALAALRVLVRRVGDVPLWMCGLAALTLALASAVPFILRRPLIYEEEIAGGYCFAMAGVWLALATLAEHRTSLSRLAAMSLCFGLAAGSRAPLALAGVVLIPVYLALRTLRPRRGLLTALLAPLAVCVVLLLAYNQARFGDPLQNGAKYQLAATDQYDAHFGDLGYIPPGLWLYALAPPRATALFPFVALYPGAHAYPSDLPANYSIIEPVGGLLPMAPVVVFLLALPWIWRRRPESLGPLALPLLALAGAGVAYMLFVSYEFFATTERYEVDFATLLLFGAVAAWLVLALAVGGWRGRMVRFGGAALACWSCIAGLMISFTGYYNLLASSHPRTWEALEDIGSPLSTGIATIVGHPLLGEFSAPSLPLLELGEAAHLVIVSPGSGTATVRAVMVPATIAAGGAIVAAPGVAGVRVADRGRAGTSYQLAATGRATYMKVELDRGLNRLTITPIAGASGGVDHAVASTWRLLYIKELALAG